MPICCMVDTLAALPPQRYRLRSSLDTPEKLVPTAPAEAVATAFCGFSCRSSSAWIWFWTGLAVGSTMPEQQPPPPWVSPAVGSWPDDGTSELARGVIGSSSSVAWRLSRWCW
uniref:(northern house mosquito) hypothetical protein n=1 Tax=Culex pipiens TaxID=7175 RepID=A0A8D8CVF6_CULPI